MGGGRGEGRFSQLQGLVEALEGGFAVALQAVGEPELMVHVGHALDARRRRCGGCGCTGRRRPRRRLGRRIGISSFFFGVTALIGVEGTVQELQSGIYMSRRPQHRPEVGTGVANVRSRLALKQGTLVTVARGVVLASPEVQISHVQQMWGDTSVPERTGTTSTTTVHRRYAPVPSHGASQGPLRHRQRIVVFGRRRRWWPGAVGYGRALAVVVVVAVVGGGGRPAEGARSGWCPGIGPSQSGRRAVVLVVVGFVFVVTVVDGPTG